MFSQFGQCCTVLLVSILLLVQGAASPADAQDSRGPAGLLLYVGLDDIEYDGTGTILVVDPTTNRTVQPITMKWGDDAKRLIVSSDGRRLYVANWFSRAISVIETATDREIGYIASLQGIPEDIAVAPDGRFLYVLGFPHDYIDVFETVTLKLMHTIGSLGEAIWDYPRRVAVSPDGKRIYVTIWLSGLLSVIDTSTRRQTALVEVEDDFYSLSGLVVSPDGTRLYLTGQKSNAVWVLDATTDPVRVVATVSVGKKPGELAVSPDGGRVYVINHEYLLHKPRRLGCLPGFRSGALPLVLPQLPTGTPWVPVVI